MANHDEIYKWLLPANHPNVRDLPKEDPTKLTGLVVETLFTNSVDFLRQLDQPDVAAMARDAWDVIHHRYVHTAFVSSDEGLDPQVRELLDRLCMIGMATGATALNVILMPWDWPAKFKENPLKQLGGVVFVCSQAVDAYNGHLKKKELAKQSTQRAEAYEATFLRHMGITDPDAAQRRVLDGPPLVSLMYSRKPVTPMS